MLTSDLLLIATIYFCSTTRQKLASELILYKLFNVIMAEAQTHSDLFIDIVGCRVYCQEHSPIIGCECIYGDSSSPIQKGDHIIHCITEYPYRPAFQSAMVVDVTERNITVIQNSLQGVKEITLQMSSLKFLHRFLYSDSGVYDVEEAVERARCRIRHNERHYDPLMNNSHHFVSWCRCGSECLLSDFIQVLENAVMNEVSYEPTTSPSETTSSTSDEDQGYSFSDENDAEALIPQCNEEEVPDADCIDSCKLVLQRAKIEVNTSIRRGDHITRKSKHWLVEAIDDRKFTGYTYSKQKIVRETVRITRDMYRIIYPDNIATVDETLEKARNQVETNEKVSYSHSDRYVTFMKSGKEYTIDETCLINDSAKPIGSTRISSDVNIGEGDHLLIKRGSRFTSVIVCNITGRYSAHVVPDESGQVKLHELYIGVQDEVYRVNYDQHLPPDEIVKRALSANGKEILRSSNNTNVFSTWATTGNAIEIHADQLIRNGQIKHVTPTHYKCVTVASEIHRGDHLFIPQYYKVYVSQYKRYHWHFMVTECNVEGNPHLYRVIYHLYGVVRETLQTLDISKGSIFKIFYSEQFPAEKAIQDARSKLSKIKVDMHSRTEFVPYAKTGSREGLEVDLMVNLSVPTSKDSISCFTQLETGDYLVVDYGTTYTYRHFLVVKIHSPDECEVIGSVTTKMKPIRSHLFLSKCKKCYKINYCAGVCKPAKESLAHANELCNETWLHSRRKFVNFLKTGNLDYKVEVNQLLDKHLYLKRQKITNARDLKVGDHIERPLNIKVIPRKIQDHTPILADTMHHMLVTKPIDDRRCMVIEAVGFKEAFPKHHEVDIFVAEDVYRVIYTERLHPREGIQRSLKECVCKEQSDDRSYTSESHEISNPIYQVLSQDNYASSSDEIEDEVVAKGSLRGQKAANPLDTPGAYDRLSDDTSHGSDRTHDLQIDIRDETDDESGQVRQAANPLDTPGAYDRLSDDTSHGSDRTHDLQIDIRDETDDESGQVRQTYHLLKNNCEHIVMLGTIGRKTSFQISIQLHRELQRIAMVPVQPSADAITRSLSKGALKALSKVAGGLIVRGVARSAAKGGITGTLTEGTEAVSLGPILSNAFKVGYPTAISSASVGLVSGVAGVLNLGIEGSLLTRDIYKLKRKRKYNIISQTDYKRGVVKQSFTRVNTFFGATGGAIVGQVAIPVPVLGAFIGSAIGTAVGKVAGHYEGEAAANKLIKEKEIDLPVTVHCKYSSY